MYKKAGLIVGSLLIVLAVVIVLIATGGSSKDKESVKPNKESKAETTAKVTETVTTVTQQEEEPELKSAVVPIDEETLPKPKVTEEIGIVQSKTVALIDGQLYYTLNMLVGADNMQLTYIVSRTGYEAANTGTRVKVHLECYVTANGTAYYLVSGVEAIE